MKCKECCGDGYNLRIIKKGSGYTTERVTCEHCNGTGEVQMTEPKLKPCPFCGREPFYVADGKVICICGAMMQSFNEWKPFTEQEAIDRWNKRVVAE